MERIQNKLIAVADAIRNKTGKNELFSLDEMPAEIAAIETGMKTDDATAAASDILSGKTAYVKGTKMTGTMPTATQATPAISVSSAGLITASSTQTAGYVAAGTKSATKQLTTKAAATITPSTSNQTIAAGTYLSGAQTIAGDADLKAANIKKGVNIFGVAGSYEGVELNFTVVGGTTQPSSATENTIWVNTSTTITSWVFSATQPSNPTAGMVWITIGASSPVTFNALKEGDIQVYPISAKQYVSGKWVDKTAKSYQGGKFVDWLVYLYKAGNQFDSLTGGWKAHEYSGGNYYQSTFTESGIEINPTGNYDNAWGLALFTINKIDISQYKTIKATVVRDTANTEPKFILGLGSTPGPSQSNFVSAKEISMPNSGTYTVEHDLSTTNGSFYVGFRVQHAKIKVTEVWLER